MKTLRDALDAAGGVAAVASAIDRSDRAVYKWLEKGSLPRSEYTGETSYSAVIAKLSNGVLTAQQILDLGKPKTQAA